MVSPYLVGALQGLEKAMAQRELKSRQDKEQKRKNELLQLQKETLALSKRKVDIAEKAEKRKLDAKIKDRKDRIEAARNWIDAREKIPKLQAETKANLEQFAQKKTQERKQQEQYEQDFIKGGLGGDIPLPKEAMDQFKKDSPLSEVRELSPQDKKIMQLAIERGALSPKFMEEALKERQETILGPYQQKLTDLSQQRSKAMGVLAGDKALGPTFLKAMMKGPPKKSAYEQKVEYMSRVTGKSPAEVIKMMQEGKKKDQGIGTREGLMKHFGLNEISLSDGALVIDKDGNNFYQRKANEVTKNYKNYKYLKEAGFQDSLSKTLLKSSPGFVSVFGLGGKTRDLFSRWGGQISNRLADAKLESVRNKFKINTLTMLKLLKSEARISEREWSLIDNLSGNLDAAGTNDVAILGKLVPIQKMLEREHRLKLSVCTAPSKFQGANLVTATKRTKACQEAKRIEDAITTIGDVRSNLNQFEKLQDERDVLEQQRANQGIVGACGFENGKPRQPGQYYDPKTEQLAVCTRMGWEPITRNITKKERAIYKAKEKSAHSKKYGRSKGQTVSEALAKKQYDIEARKKVKVGKGKPKYVPPRGGPGVLIGGGE